MPVKSLSRLTKVAAAASAGRGHPKVVFIQYEAPLLTRELNSGVEVACSFRKAVKNCWAVSANSTPRLPFGNLAISTSPPTIAQITRRW
jgi:hypothetical protein